MATRVDETADGIYRLSTWVRRRGPPAGFTFGQFLINAVQPLLFHTGMRAMFSLISTAAAGRSRWSACAGSGSGKWKPTSAPP